MLAFDEAHRYQKSVRSDWRQVNIEKVLVDSFYCVILNKPTFFVQTQMEVALRLKFTQHPDLKASLLGTGEADLVEVRVTLSFRTALVLKLILGFPT